ncbi:MAG: hypothetical protein ACC726_03225, partial [Chloroflexota bacterium]
MTDELRPIVFDHDGHIGQQQFMGKGDVLHEGAVRRDVRGAVEEVPSVCPEPHAQARPCCRRGHAESRHAVYRFQADGCFAVGFMGWSDRPDGIPVLCERAHLARHQEAE